MRANLTDQEATLCSKIGCVILLVNWDLLSRSTFNKLARECSLLYSNHSSNRQEIQRALLHARDELTAGRHIVFSAAKLQITYEFQLFWEYIGRVHSSSESREGFKLFTELFPSRIYSSAEICAWLQKKRTNDSYLDWYLEISHFKEFSEALKQFKYELDIRGIKFRLGGYYYKNVIKHARYWRAFSARGFAASRHIKSNVSEHIKSNVASGEIQQNAAHAREWLDDHAYGTARVDIAAELAEVHWARESSPRPCRCGENPCWCVDPREIMIAQRVGAILGTISVIDAFDKKAA